VAVSLDPGGVDDVAGGDVTVEGPAGEGAVVEGPVLGGGSAVAGPRVVPGTDDGSVDGWMRGGPPESAGGDTDG
jgi:hypothetical protein